MCKLINEKTNEFQIGFDTNSDFDCFDEKAHTYKK